MESGAATTTVRVKRTTRDLLSDYGAQHDMTVDEIVRAGLEALQWEALRKRAAYDATRLSHDPEYAAEMRAVQEDLHGRPAEDARATG